MKLSAIPQVALAQLREKCSMTVPVSILDKAKFGSELKKLRKGAKLTLLNMSKAIGLSQAYISYCEAGYRTMKKEAQIKFVKECLK